MYESYFGLSERPFSIAPDPQYLYMSSRHKEAMAHLSYGLSQGGCFIVLTGEVGTGKTTLCRNLLGQLPENVDIALILNANINEIELLQTICDERKITYPAEASQKQLLDLINEYLLRTFADNRHTVLIIDEAQLLSRDVLEQIRLLTNLETNKAKLLQIILIGQPELSELLTRNDLRQLAQRVTARYHLGALQRSEIEEYVNYRLSVAGCKQALFSKQALHKLHSMTDGIPRKINVLADHALLAAYAKSQAVVDAKTVKDASKDVFFETGSQGYVERVGAWFHRVFGLNYLFSFAIGALLLNIGLWWFFIGSQERKIDEQTVTSPETVLLQDSESNAAKPALDASGNLVQDDTAQELVELTEETTASVDPGAAGLAEQQATKSVELEPNDTSTTPGVVVIAEQELDASVDPNLSVNELLVGGAKQSNVRLAPQTQLSGSTLSESTVAPRQDASQYRESELSLLLETSADTTGRITAFRNLTELWGEKLPDQLIQPACETLVDKDLVCIGFNDWEQMVRFNRPAILVLGHENQLHRVIIGDIDGDLAEVAVGTTVRSVPIGELKARWNNNGVVFWRPNPSLSTDTSRDTIYVKGAYGPTIAAIRPMLNQALERAGIPPLSSTDNPEFDLEMSQKVYALQTRFGIIGDGRIGAETQMLMNELLEGDKIPVLYERTR